MWEIFAVEYGILGFEIRNTAQEIRNPNNNWNPESKPDSGIWEIFACEIWNPRIWNLEYSSRDPESY